MPDVGRDGFNLFIVQAEVRHLGRWAEVGGLFQPHRNPIFVKFEANVLQVRPNFFHVLKQALGRAVELHDAQIDFAVFDLERNRAFVEVIRFFVGLRLVGLCHEVVGLFEIVFLLLLEQLDLLTVGEQVFRLFVVTFVAMAANAPALAEQVFSLADNPADVVDRQDHVCGVANLAAGFVVLRGKNRPQPVLVIAMSFFDACCRAAISLMARRAAKFLRIMNSQQIPLGMAGERSRVFVRLFPFQRHGRRRKLQRLANSKVA